MANLNQGYIQVYTGDGKGKTTAALGLAVRAAGHGMRTFIGQFMKGQDYGELAALRDHPLITIEQFGKPSFIHVCRATPEDIALAQRGLERAHEVLTGGEYDIVVLDEIDVAVFFELISEDDVLTLIEARPPHVELIITGRRAPQAVIDRADLVTEMREVKHYYQQGVIARKGIEN